MPITVEQVEALVSLHNDHYKLFAKEGNIGLWYNVEEQMFKITRDDNDIPVLECYRSNTADAVAEYNRLVGLDL